MHTARDEDPGAVLFRLAAAQRELAIAVGWIVELPVLFHLEACRQAFDARHDVVGITPQPFLLREPSRSFWGAPGHACGADRVGVQREVLRTKSATVSCNPASAGSLR